MHSEGVEQTSELQHVEVELQQGPIDDRGVVGQVLRDRSCRILQCRRKRLW